MSFITPPRITAEPGTPGETEMGGTEFLGRLGAALATRRPQIGSSEPIDTTGFAAIFGPDSFGRSEERTAQAAVPADFRKLVAEAVAEALQDLKDEAEQATLMIRNLRSELQDSKEATAQALLRASEAQNALSLAREEMVRMTSEAQDARDEAEAATTVANKALTSFRVPLVAVDHAMLDQETSRFHHLSGPPPVGEDEEDWGMTEQVDASASQTPAVTTRGKWQDEDEDDVAWTRPAPPMLSHAPEGTVALGWKDEGEQEQVGLTNSSPPGTRTGGRAGDEEDEGWGPPAAEPAELPSRAEGSSGEYLQHEKAWVDE